MSFELFLIALVAASVALCAIMAGAWFVQQRTRNSGWVDTIWTFGLGAVGIVAALAPLGGWRPRGWLIAALISVWALRLGLHIATRTAKITDDPRYAELQRGWGANARREMFWLLQKQAWVSIPLAASMILAAHAPAPGFRFEDGLGLIVMAIGITGEGLADHQLRQFRADPANKGRVCDRGLWALSRHPNYFFEWTIWLGFPIFAFDSSFPLGWIAWLGPACIYWLLVYVSGIPPLEEHMLRARGEQFRAYQRRVSAFFPWPSSTGTRCL